MSRSLAQALSAYKEVRWSASRHELYIVMQSLWHLTGISGEYNEDSNKVWEYTAHEWLVLSVES